MTEPRDGLLAQVGNTPLVELTRMSADLPVRLFAKLEGHNPSGSVKDRVALALVEEAERAGRLKPGQTIVEASSGNTGIALTMVARRKGYQVKIVLPKEVAPSIGDALALFGADCIWCPNCVGMDDAIRRAAELSEKHGWYPLGQFTQSVNVETHYRTTGAEIVRQLGRVDAFVAGIGTGGTVMGVGRRLREHNPGVRIIGVEPRLGERLQGLCCLDRGFRPPLLDLDQLDGRILVDNPSAIAAAQELATTEGICAGISAGASLVAARKVASRMDSGNVVLMFSDGGWKYLPARPWEAARAGDQRLDDVHWW